MGPYFDSHCHLQDPRLLLIVDEVLHRARAAGVDRVVTCGCREEDWDAVLALSRLHREVLPSLGLHPWYVHEASGKWCERLEALVRAEPVGVGECGLDFALEVVHRSAQEEAFHRQLVLAKVLHRPVSIHCRKAWEALESMVRATGLPACGGVIHAYSGSAEMVRSLRDLGFYFSFGCSLANPRNHRAAKAVKAVPLDRLLFETDAPDMPPQGFELNEPMHIGVAARAAAQHLERPQAELEALAHGNALRMFGGIAGGSEVE